ncbi:MAG TPA: MaoC family dehydratase [Gammaproteobacteria bacterium]|nr:MaoC family dehydratase [Gammaproteobacteria bacterium]
MSMQSYFFEDMQEGMEASFSKTVTEADIVLFAGVTGDLNPVHVDAEFAAASMFKQRIAHGMLSASFISTVFGTRLPGPGCIYVSQSVRFRAPVFIGDTVTARVKVTGLKPERNMVMFDTVCTVGGKEVVSGDAVIMVPRREQG